MSLTPGTRLGPYEIVGPLGAGGMGEVYRAKDTRLGREVAVKVLPEHLMDSAEVRARFEREARTVSSLNHPHICTLHDVGREGATDFLVMELVDGETLAARLERGPLPLSDVLRVGIQIADALDRAHRAGVVHRDLKPGNVMLTRTGAKLMDFGLARATGTAGQTPGSAPGVTALTQSPTMAGPLTSQGSIVGTFQYMAPEQLEGGEADTRSDLWALGCLLYESATGRRPFAGKSQASLIGAIMNTEPPPISQAMPLVPPALERLVHACLTKDPDERIQTAHDVRLQLEWIRDAGSQAGLPAPVAARRHLRERIAWTLAAVGLAAAALSLYFRPAAGVVAERFEGSILPPAGSRLVQYTSAISLSPDGRYLVFAARGDKEPGLWLRPLASDTATAIPDGVLGNATFWSPDSRFFAYATLDGKLKKIAIPGGTPTTICNLKWARGGTWGRKDTIVFAPAPEGPLVAVPAAGGVPAPVTTLDAGLHQKSHRFPVFLPDGEHFLFLAMPRTENGYDTFVGSLHDAAVKKVLTAESAAIYAEPGVLVFRREGKIMVQPFDTGRLDLTGEPLAIAEAAPTTDLDAEPVASVSDNGRLAFLRSGARATRLAWIDRTGAIRGTVPLAPGDWTMFRLSPDERHAALMKNGDIWLVDLTRAIPTRFDSTFSSEANVTWLRDGRRLAWSSNRSGRAEIYFGDLDGGQPAEIVPTTDAIFKTVWDVTDDGKFLIIGSVDDSTGWDIWLLPMEKGARPIPYETQPGAEMVARVSPDGRWLAYTVGNTAGSRGEGEVFVQSFPKPGRKVRVSVDGGDLPQWTQDGKELLYLKDDTLISVAMSGGADLAPGAPTALMTLPAGTTGIGATRDGQRFLVTVGPDAERDIRVILSWTSLLKR